VTTLAVASTGISIASRDSEALLMECSPADANVKARVSPST
jgi:hypothetical protein